MYAAWIGGLAAVAAAIVAARCSADVVPVQSPVPIPVPRALCDVEVVIDDRDHLRHASLAQGSQDGERTVCLVGSGYRSALQQVANTAIGSRNVYKFTDVPADTSMAVVVSNTTRKGWRFTLSIQAADGTALLGGQMYNVGDSTDRTANLAGTAAEKISVTFRTPPP